MMKANKDAEFRLIDQIENQKRTKFNLNMNLTNVQGRIRTSEQQKQIVSIQNLTIKEELSLQIEDKTDIITSLLEEKQNFLQTIEKMEQDYKKLNLQYYEQQEEYGNFSKKDKKLKQKDFDFEDKNVKTRDHVKSIEMKLDQVDHYLNEKRHLLDIIDKQESELNTIRGKYDVMNKQREQQQPRREISQ